MTQRLVDIIVAATVSVLSSAHPRPVALRIRSCSMVSRFGADGIHIGCPVFPIGKKR
jgi:hypothetical protein